MSDVLGRLLFELGNLIKVSEALLVITITTVGLRLVSRIRYAGGLKPEDYVMIIAVLAFTAACSLAVAIGTMTQEVFQGKAHDMDFIQILVNWTLFLYVLSSVLIKTSIGLLFARIFSSFPVQKAIVYAIIISSWTVGIPTAVMAAATCGLPAWSTGAPADCPVKDAYGMINSAYAGVNALTDWTWTALALNALWQAKLPKRIKLVTGAVLLLGTSGGIVSMFRFAFLQVMGAPAGRPWLGVVYSYLSLLEAGVSMTAASLACLSPLFRRFFASKKPPQRKSRVAHAPGCKCCKNSEGPLELDMETLEAHLISVLGTGPRTVADWRMQRICEEDEVETMPVDFVSTTLVVSDGELSAGSRKKSAARKDSYARKDSTGWHAKLGW